MIERRLADSDLRIHENEFVRLRAGLDAISKGIVGEPLRFDFGAKNQIGGARTQGKGAVKSGEIILRGGKKRS